MSEAELRAFLSGLPLSQIEYFTSIPSTNDEALRLIETGAVDNLLLYAEEQTAGRGRLNRRWVTPPGGALAFSIVFIPNEEEHHRLPYFSFLGALAVCFALQKCCALNAQVKWPNDVLLDRKKCCGILVETSSLGSAVMGVVLGIGINVGKEAIPPAAEMLYPPTSVEAESGIPVDRFLLLKQILADLLDWRPRLASPQFRREYERRLAFRGESVEIRQKDTATVGGILQGVDAQGRLLLQSPSGDLLRITAGDLRLRPAD